MTRERQPGRKAETEEEGRPEEDRPNDEAVQIAEENRGARHVLDALREWVLLGAQVIDDEFDRGVEQFDDEDQGERSDHQRGGDRVDGEDDRERNQQEREDQAFAERLYADLQSKGIRCWFAPEDMKIGDRMRDRIDQSIRLYDKLLLILSEQSVISEWVEDEVEAALEKQLNDLDSAGTTDSSLLLQKKAQLIYLYLSATPDFVRLLTKNKKVMKGRFWKSPIFQTRVAKCETRWQRRA